MDKGSSYCGAASVGSTNECLVYGLSIEFMTKGKIGHWPLEIRGLTFHI